MAIEVYDLDGTLRNVTCADHLVPEDKSNPVNWVEWQHYVNTHGTVLDAWRDYDRAVMDKAILDTAVYILTSSHFGTRRWLNKEDLPQPDKIIERRVLNGRHPVQYKKDWLNRNAHDVVKWVDDSQEVCDYVRKTYPHIEVVQVGAPQQPEPEFDTPLSRFINAPASIQSEIVANIIDKACEEQGTIMQPNKASSPLDVQVGGDHYKKLKIQPAEYCAKNDIGFLEGSVIKYATRHESKNGIEDINKAIHFLELIKNLKYGEQK